jgi:hypothetical protein
MSIYLFSDTETDKAAHVSVEFLMIFCEFSDTGKSELAIFVCSIATANLTHYSRGTFASDTVILGDQFSLSLSPRRPHAFAL